MIYEIMPVYKNYIWGGTNLITKYHARSNFSTIAEAWIFSTHKDGPCLVKNGNKLSELVMKSPYLIKILDSRDTLSVQVHPNDEVARIQEGDNGKSEVWYILDHEPNAFIYLGLKRETTKEEFAIAVENGTLLDYLQRIEVKTGDFFYIAAGTIHALGEGITALEIQQSSNATYRLYDYKRVDDEGKERELHIEKGLNAIDFSKIGMTSYQDVKQHKSDNYVENILIECEYFNVKHYQFNKKIRLSFDPDKVNSLVILSGIGSIDGEEVHGLSTFLIKSEGLTIETSSGIEFVTIVG